ncbi:MAG: hypothetical protein IH991_07040 [Planctomycetes bacterium]|nr:hypothetical protein [Planctomycetota bacterium]
MQITTVPKSATMDQTTMRLFKGTERPRWDVLASLVVRRRLDLRRDNESFKG